MTTFSSSHVCRNVNRRSHTDFVAISQSKESDYNFQISLFNTKGFLRCVVEADNASSQQFRAVLKTRTTSETAQKPGILFAATDHLLLREARMRHVRQVLRASTAVQIFAGSDARVPQEVFTLFRIMASFLAFSNKSTLMQSFLTKEEGSHGDQSSAVRLENHGSVAGTGYVRGFLQDFRLRAKLHWKTGSRDAMTIRLVTTGRIAL